MTGTAWILGAGFSKAISEHMPTMKELGVAMCSTIAADADLVPLLSAAERAAIRSDIPLGDLEVWLTSLASPQPFLNESENLRRAALSSRLTEIIADEIEGRRRLACGDERPKWLVDLITLWHYGEDAVLSLNYDTLVENCLESMALRRPDLSNTVVRTSSILRFYPRGVPREGGIWFGQEPVDTFEFLKLHGSTNWYALPGTVDVSRVDELIRGWVSDAPTLPPMLAAPLRGATKAILIPTADKSVGHAKPVFANIWRAARGRLENATELVLFGYSLPPSDSSIRALLSQSVSTEIPVTIIDPNAAAVRERLHQLGLKAEGTDMQVGSTEFDRALCRWATDRSHLVDWSLLDDCAKLIPLM